MTAVPPLRITGIYAHRKGLERKIPLFLAKVAAEFPSPADDYLDKKIDLNEELIRHPAATFFVRVEGDSMRDAGIFSGDLLIVDHSLEAKENAVVVAVLDGEFYRQADPESGREAFSRSRQCFLFPDRGVRGAGLHRVVRGAW
jgi:SOS-response transcriptional repressor LexA